MKNFRGENTEDSIRYSWTQFYEQCRLNPDSVPVVLSLHKIGDSPYSCFVQTLSLTTIY